MSSQINNHSASDEFLAAARRGDARAWERIVQEYRPYLFAVANRSLESRASGECSSVVQDGLARAYERIEQFRGRTRAELLAWLSRIVANKAHDKRLAPKPPTIHAGSDGEVLVAASDSTPSVKVMRRERAARVIDAMEKLPSDYREVVYQRVFLNLGYEEIASRLGRTNDAVRWLWVRALRRLRDELGEEP